MNYKVKFELAGFSVSYNVEAQNAVEAEDEARKQLKKDDDIKTEAANSGIDHPETGWEVKQIESIIEDGREGE